MDSEMVSENQTASRRVHTTAYNLFILLLTACSLTLIAGLVILGPGDTELHAVLVRVDFLICMVFLFDFALTLIRVDRKVEYVVKQGGLKVGRQTRKSPMGPMPSGGRWSP